VTILKENNETASVRQLANTRVVYRRGPVNAVVDIGDDTDLLKLYLPTEKLMKLIKLQYMKP
jgi:hypothetical protein